MKKFTITNGENQEINVELVRYFKFKNDLFLIYTKNEYDEKNYIKLYLVRIMEELGFPVVQTIRNDADWALMQGIVKKVLKEIKSGKPKLLEDMDYTNIVGIKVVNPRYFKLETKLAETLASNYMEDNEMNDNVGKSEKINNLEQKSLEENAINEQVNVINTSMGVTPLESIDATIEKEEKFEPQTIEKEENEITAPIIEPIKIDDVNSTMNNVNYNEEMKSIDNNINNQENNANLANNLIQEDIINDIKPIENINNNTEIHIPLEPIPNKINEKEEAAEERFETIQPSSENNLNDNIETDIDYKSLYMAVKRENETSAELINNLMSELLKYKETFGNLQEENKES